MKIVMKFRNVEVTHKGVVSVVRLDSIRDAIAFTKELERVCELRNEELLPENFLSLLYNHLLINGKIKTDAFNRKMIAACRMHRAASNVSKSVEASMSYA